MSRLLAILLICASLFGMRAIVNVVATSPAFHGDLRSLDVYGNQVPILSDSMYNQPIYLLQVGTSFVRADLLPSGDTEALGVYADTALAMARADTAIELLSQSLRQGPSNALAWETLSWAYFLSGRPELAKTALEASWALAPFNARLANQRLTLYAALKDLRVGGVEAGGSKSVKNDLGTLKQHNPEDYTYHSSELSLAN